MRKRGAPPVGLCLAATLRRRAVSARIYKPAESKRPTLIRGPFAEAHLAGGRANTTRPDRGSRAGRQAAPKYYNKGPRSPTAGRQGRPGPACKAGALVLALPGSRAGWYGASPPLGQPLGRGGAPGSLYQRDIGAQAPGETPPKPRPIMGFRGRGVAPWSAPFSGAGAARADKRGGGRGGVTFQVPTAALLRVAAGTFPVYVLSVS